MGFMKSFYQTRTFCLWRHTGSRESFPRQLPFLSWPSRACIVRRTHSATSAIRQAKSLDDVRWHRNHDFTVRSDSLLQRNLEFLSRDYPAPSGDSSALSREYAFLLRDYPQSRDHQCSELSAHTQSVPPQLHERSFYGEPTLLVEWKQKNLVEEIMTMENTTMLCLQLFFLPILGVKDNLSSVYT